ncbi:MAG: glycine cleavage system aminomethyltransferase GcvT [Actinomycetota bacterium]|nr:glycine cleavage system aminomethyltransferase GcvT [Actinomycetota bacterium]
MALKQSPLHDRHVQLGAKFAEFGGWEMPLEYPAGVIKEHTAVRDWVGLFDVSHLGKVVVRGEGAQDYVNASLSNDLGKIHAGKAQYTLCCDVETGGIVDDLIVYLLDEDHLLLVPNAANTAEVVRRLDDAKPESVTITDRHESHAVLAVQGPRSDEVLDAMGFPAGHEYMSFVQHPYDGELVVVCRTGYTGERGYELIVAHAAAGGVWDELMRAGTPYEIQPCGLGARDTLRTEMGYPLHGQDITLQVTPNQARLGWAVGWEKPAFWGRDALVAEKETGPVTRLSGLVADGRGIARPGMRVTLADDSPVGEVTSGTFSPTLRKGVALALLDDQVTDGAEVSVDVRGRPAPFTVTRPPFVKTDVKEG